MNAREAKRIETIRKQLARITARIGKDRDQLRELIDEAEALEESVRDAFESLEYAADALSRYA
jgi:uncharacterized coiled-coil protein SlyX